MPPSSVAARRQGYRSAQSSWSTARLRRTPRCTIDEWKNASQGSGNEEDEHGSAGSLLARVRFPHRRASSLGDSTTISSVAPAVPRATAVSRATRRSISRSIGETPERRTELILRHLQQIARHRPRICTHAHHSGRKRSYFGRSLAHFPFHGAPADTAVHSTDAIEPRLPTVLYGMVNDSCST